LEGTSQSKVLAKINSNAGLMLQAHMGNVGLKNLYPDTIRYPLKKSKRTDNIIDFVHAIM
jgi:hypothetical protein